MELMIIIATVLSFAVLSTDTSQHFPPPLGKEEEKKLFEKLADSGDREARMLLIEHNLRLVAHVVRKYYASNDSQEDLISVGTVGLIKAVDTFNIKNGARFATYAAKCIQNEILMYFRAKKKTGMEVSISDTIETDRDGNSLTYMDVIKCEDTIAEDIDTKMKISAALKYINTSLSQRERRIIMLRYGLGGGRALTQRETAQRLNISRSYVSRIEKSALQKLSCHINGRTL